jgi:hypothetical protein
VGIPNLDRERTDQKGDITQSNQTPETLQQKEKVKKVFFIGYNRTATTSFHNLFKKCGYESWHCIRPEGGHIGRYLMDNMEEGNPILEGLEEAEVLSDLCYAKLGRFFEGTHAFQLIHEACPDAYFVLQTRSTESWIRSRSRHKRGDFLTRTRKHYRTKDKREVYQIWREDKEKWETKIREYFSQRPEAKFLEFNIETDDISKLQEFVKPDFNLKRRYWRVYNKTKR